MSRRLTRKEIKQDIRSDEVQSFLVRVFDRLQQNPSLVIGAVVGFVALVIAISGLLAYLSSRRSALNEELAQAIKIATAEVLEEGATPDDPDAPSFATREERRARAREAFEKVRGSGAVGAVAELQLARMAAEEGDTATAREIWREFLDDHEDHMLAVAVWTNLIHLDRQEGRAETLAAELEAELADDDRKRPEDLLLYELARTLETLDRDEEAAELYQRILDDHPQSPYAMRAQQATAG